MASNKRQWRKTVRKAMNFTQKNVGGKYIAEATNDKMTALDLIKPKNVSPEKWERMVKYIKEAKIS